MRRRGRTAALPGQPHRRPQVLEEGGLVVEHRDPQGRTRSYDFAVLPIPPVFQRSLAALYAAKCAPGGGWDSVKTSEGTGIWCGPSASSSPAWRTCRRT